MREDVRREGEGPWFIHLHAEGDARSLKYPQSERMVPLHPALVAEGFLAYVQALRPGSPLFPDLRPDTFGTLKGTATKKHGRWVRKVVGITDTTKDPAHAWRHRFEDQARRAGVPQNVTDGLLGHLNAANEFGWLRARLSLHARHYGALRREDGRARGACGNVKIEETRAGLSSCNEGTSAAGPTAGLVERLQRGRKLGYLEVLLNPTVMGTRPT